MHSLRIIVHLVRRLGRYYSGLSPLDIIIAALEELLFTHR